VGFFAGATSFFAGLGFGTTTGAVTVGAGVLIKFGGVTGSASRRTVRGVGGGEGARFTGSTTAGC
jgi:hypothetical protein